MNQLDEPLGIAVGQAAHHVRWQNVGDIVGGLDQLPAGWQASPLVQTGRQAAGFRSLGTGRIPGIGQYPQAAVEGQHRVMVQVQLAPQPRVHRRTALNLCREQAATSHQPESAWTGHIGRSTQERFNPPLSLERIEILVIDPERHILVALQQRIAFPVHPEAVPLLFQLIIRRGFIGPQAKQRLAEMAPTDLIGNLIRCQAVSTGLEADRTLEGCGARCRHRGLSHVLILGQQRYRHKERKHHEGNHDHGFRQCLATLAAP